MKLIKKSSELITRHQGSTFHWLTFQWWTYQLLLLRFQPWRKWSQRWPSWQLLGFFRQIHRGRRIPSGCRWYQRLHQRWPWSCPGCKPSFLDLWTRLGRVWWWYRQRRIVQVLPGRSIHQLSFWHRRRRHTCQLTFRFSWQQLCLGSGLWLGQYQYRDRCRQLGFRMMACWWHPCGV